MNSQNVYHETRERLQDFRMVLHREPTALVFAINTTAETHQESCGTTRPDTFPSQIYLWYFKVNVVKEEEYPREYRGRCLAGRARSRCQRSHDEVSAALRLQKKLFRLSQSDSSDTRSSSPISRGHSAGAPCKMGFSTCARSGDHQTKMHLGDCNHGGCSALFFFLWSRESRSSHLFPLDCF